MNSFYFLIFLSVPIVSLFFLLKGRFVNQYDYSSKEFSGSILQLRLLLFSEVLLLAIWFVLILIDEGVQESFLSIVLIIMSVPWGLFCTFYLVVAIFGTNKLVIAVLAWAFRKNQDLKLF